MQVTEAGATNGADAPLNACVSPRFFFPLSHVALPFPINNSLYGMEPDKTQAEFFGVPLGAIAPRGERGVLILNLDALLRVSSHPFFPYLSRRIDQAIASPRR